MQIKLKNTIMAFLLAFHDLKTSLNEQEKQNLKEVAKQLDTQPKAWKSHTERFLLEIIAANPELNRAYQFYKYQLDNVEDIPQDLLPGEAEINSLIDFDKAAIAKGFKPQSQVRGYENQLNNVVVVVGGSENPEETVKHVTFLGNVKGFLSQSNSLN